MHIFVLNYIFFFVYELILICIMKARAVTKYLIIRAFGLHINRLISKHYPFFLVTKMRISLSETHRTNIQA